MSYDIVNEHLADRQIKAACKIHNAHRGIVYWKMGEGKSRIALAVADLKHFKPPAIILIVCRRKAFDVWRDELLKVGLNWMVREFPKEQGYSKSKQTVWLLSHAMLHKVYNILNQYPISIFIYDELYLYSNPKSALTKSALDLRFLFSNSTPIIGLSGTLMSAADNLSIYSQANVVGIGHTLARTPTDFRSKFQTFFDIDFAKKGSAHERIVRQYRNKPGSFQRIKHGLLPYCDFYFPANKDREARHVDIHVDLSTEQKKAIKQLKSEYYYEDEESGVSMELRSTLEVIHRVSQVSNGYLLSKGQIAKRFACPKLDALDNKVEEIIGNGGRCIVWCYYRSDVALLRNHFKFKTLQMSGDIEFDKRLWKSGKVSVVLATVGIGSSFNDFAQVEYAIYYSHSNKFLDLEQSKARTLRRNSRHKIAYYYHLLSRGTFDSNILEAARDSESTQEKFIKLCQPTLQSL